MYFDICNKDAPLFQAVKSATAAKKDDNFADLFPHNGWEGVFARTPRSHWGKNSIELLFVDDIIVLNYYYGAINAG